MQRRWWPKTFVCPVCGTKFTLTGDQQRQIATRKKHHLAKTGPYCKRQCAAIGGGRKIC